MTAYETTPAPIASSELLTARATRLGNWLTTIVGTYFGDNPVHAETVLTDQVLSWRSVRFYEGSGRYFGSHIRDEVAYRHTLPGTEMNGSEGLVCFERTLSLLSGVEARTEGAYAKSDIEQETIVLRGMSLGQVRIEAAKAVGWEETVLSGDGGIVRENQRLECQKGIVPAAVDEQVLYYLKTIVSQLDEHTKERDGQGLLMNDPLRPGSRFNPVTDELPRLYERA